MAKLVVTSGGARRSVELGDEPVEIGRDLACAVVIEDPLSSRRHCRVQRAGDGFELVDLGSSNGTLHNGARVDRAPLAAGDRIQIGEVRIDFIAEPAAQRAAPPRPAEPERSAPERAPAARPAAAKGAAKPGAAASSESGGPELIIVNGPSEGERHPLRAPFTIGRKEGCDLVLADKKVSGEHARIERQGDRWVIRDLESGNGLYVGRNRVSKHRLLDGDLLGIGDVRLRVRGLPPDPAMDESSSASRIFRAVDEGEITEDDLSRLRVRPEEEASSLQGVYTGGFVVVLGVILFYGYSMITGLVTGGAPAVDPDNLLGAAASFERAPAAGWGSLWAADAAGDPVQVEALRGEEVPQGRGALRFASSGGERGIVRLLEVEAHEVSAADSFLVAGQVRNSGFERVGLAVTWYTRRGGDLFPIDESYTELTDRPMWTRLSAILAPPAVGEPQACRLALLAIGRGSAEIDDLVLKRVPREAAEPLAVEVVSGGAPLRARLDERGILEVVRGGDRWLRQLRFARPGETGVPWGQLLPSRYERPGRVESGAILNSFELGRGSGAIQVSQVSQAAGDRIKIAWTAPSAMVVFELDRTIADQTISAFAGETAIAEGIPWAEADGLECDELVLGAGSDHLIIGLGAPGRLALLDERAGRGARAVTWTPAQAVPGGVLECFISTVSDRERLRLDEMWSSVSKARAEGREGEALATLAAIEREFRRREDAVARARSERAEIEAAAESAWKELLAIRDDLRKLPRTPIAGVLLERSEEFAHRFAGTARAGEAGGIAAEVRGRAGGLAEEARRERARELLEVGDGYFQSRRDRIARFYFEWLRREHPDTEEARTAALRIDLIEARGGR